MGNFPISVRAPIMDPRKVISTWTLRAVIEEYCWGELPTGEKVKYLNENMREKKPFRHRNSETDEGTETVQIIEQLAHFFCFISGASINHDQTRILKLNRERIRFKKYMYKARIKVLK